jgi:hypothetical protein
MIDEITIGDCMDLSAFDRYSETTRKRCIDNLSSHRHVAVLKRFATGDGTFETDLLSSVHALIRAGLSGDAILSELNPLLAKKYGDSEKRILRAIETTTSLSPPNNIKKKKTLLRKNATILEVESHLTKIQSTGFTKQLADSPEPVDLKVKDVLRKHYINGELVCMGKKTSRAFTKPREYWLKKPNRELEMFQLRVPNPMTGETGTNKSGKPSKRCGDNSAKSMSRVVFECDILTKKQQLFVISYLRQALPLVSVCFSGRSSFHAQFSLLGLSEREKIIVMNRMICLGGDRATCVSHQLIRTPNAIRSDEKVKSAAQKLIYMDSGKRDTYANSKF